MTYTISDQGARVTRGNPAGETWLFMGCSFTFGEGVSDDETLPAQFSEQLGGAANVLNLGLNGYGPHQMLRMLETGRLGGATRPVKHVIYQALVSHVPRAAGRATWGLTAPAYVIAGDSIRFGGQLNQSSVVRSFAMFQRSDLARLLLRRRYDASPTDEEIELFARIVEKAAEIARTRLGARFTILFWDYEDETTRRVHDRLVSTGLPVIRATSLVAHDRDSLRIPYDRHPSAEAYRRLASGLAAQ